MSIDKKDGRPYLSEDQAYELLRDALDEYGRALEHMPALWDDVKRKFADETSAQRLAHHEIACRYADDDRFTWDDRQEGKRRRRAPAKAKVRLRELERFFRHRYGVPCPTTTAAATTCWSPRITSPRLTGRLTGT
ncbi:hypothetical protein [Bradyrhizobium sp. CCBAU 53415]|uniref:hypothetical protein n=1 Tax=Bradyrhizobium sp. CCBAU 53415 TaxID=1325119 RepID=UPI002304EB2D|nr:hypothetical protein [Bradyrhizobium sp. CCBAU 53415]MDA9467034.1 hypothetical protein [Bradyrhizobium sp. CCBAU 53415]